MVVKIIIEMVRMKLAGSDEGIGSLIKDLEEPLESVELRMNIISEPRHAKARAIDVIETFRSYVEVFVSKHSEIKRILFHQKIAVIYVKLTSLHP